MEFVIGWSNANRLVGVTAATVVSVLARSADEEDRDRRRLFLANAVVFSTTADIVRTAERLLWTVPLPTRLTADDAITAVTAVAENLPLYTLDPDRYAGIPGLTTHRAG